MEASEPDWAARMGVSAAPRRRTRNSAGNERTTRTLRLRTHKELSEIPGESCGSEGTNLAGVYTREMIRGMGFSPTFCWSSPLPLISIYRFGVLILAAFEMGGGPKPVSGFTVPNVRG